MPRILPLTLVLLAVCPAISSAQPALHPRVIVFVHGIHGDRNSWRASTGAYWPDLVGKDPTFRLSDVVVAEYPTPSSNGKYSTSQLADILWKSLNANGVWNHDEVVFVAHSLGGLITEEMLLAHPESAKRVRFIVSYGTPHEGSFVANLAKIYDSDPLLTDLSSGNDNQFLLDLENRWRKNSQINVIHRFCAYEMLDTHPQSGLGKLLGTHIRVVTPYSATYGCDTTTPWRGIQADHIDIIKPADPSAEAYKFFADVYRNNPVIRRGTVIRENRVYESVDCNHTTSDQDLKVPITLDGSLHELLVGATAEYVDKSNTQGESPPAVTSVDPSGVAHVRYGFNGLDKNWLGNCPGGGHLTILVKFSIAQEVPIR